MFDGISTQQTCRAASQTVDCTLPRPTGFKTNPDIAGIGVVYSYKVTALLTLVFATSLMVVDSSELFRSSNRHERLEGKQQQPYRSRPRRILEVVVLSFSDQQLITGLGMLIAVHFYLGCSISAYHYDIVCNLILMSLVTHLASLAVISRYFSNWLLGPLRVILIIFAFGLTGVMFAERDNTRFPTGVPKASATSNMTAPLLLAAAACFTSENINITDQFATQLDIFEGATQVSGLAEYAVLFVITIFGLIMAVSQSIVTSSSRSRIHLCARQWIFVFRLILLVGAWGIAIAAYLKFDSLRKWLAASPWPSDDAEHRWDFGQLVPCFLLLLAPLAFFEACGGIFTPFPQPNDPALTLCALSDYWSSSRDGRSEYLL